MKTKRRVMIKITGEGLSSKEKNAFDDKKCIEVAKQIKQALSKGIQIAVVIGEDETLFQYIRECGEGYVVGLENKRKSRLKMKIVLEGLECKDSNKGKDEVVFYIPGKSKKTFNLVVKKNYYGDCTFQFDFA